MNTVSSSTLPNIADKNSISAATIQYAAIEHRGDDRYIVIENHDEIPPFFCTLTTDADLWMFIASNGNLTAGRRDPDFAILPYETVDKIYDNGHHTGALTLFRWKTETGYKYWLPFQNTTPKSESISRRLLKNTIGSRLIFEEYHQEEDLLFTATWMLSDRFGIVRDYQLLSQGKATRRIEVLHGLRNVVASGISRKLQNELSCLTDAYKQNEIIADQGMGVFTMASGLTDLPIPNESLKATVVWSYGLRHSRQSVYADNVAEFLGGKNLTFREKSRGVRANFLEWAEIEIKNNETCQWKLVADTDLHQAAISDLLDLIKNGLPIRDIEEDVALGEQNLLGYLASADGLQHGKDEISTAHHLANTLFNVMRGGIFADAYTIDRNDFLQFVATANRQLASSVKDALADLPEKLERRVLRKHIEALNDPQLTRIFLEYLPLSFSRRHGDPSRPWNQFRIQIRDAKKNNILFYQGNWRDIFQNWEALALSFPQYLDGMISKFVNASTADGYNPYRITRDGIDWEEPEPENPWAAFGYWGDHQIIYLLKLMEVFKQHFPERLSTMLNRKLFTYANVPYRLKGYQDILKDPRNTMLCDEAEGAILRKNAALHGSDQKLILGADGQPSLVNLTEKLLVPLLAKWTNFIPGGGIWMNTQRPEWNDANNALVGYGISMVTLYYMRRHQQFLIELLQTDETGTFEISAPVVELLQSSLEILSRHDPDSGCTDLQERRRIMDALGGAGEVYRSKVYQKNWIRPQQVSKNQLLELLTTLQKWTDHTIRLNNREDGLYNAYNLLVISDDSAGIAYLDPMLEGQVAVLSAGILSAEESLRLLQSMRNSPLYCPRRNSYILYPDRVETPFLEKNKLPASRAGQSRLLQQMLKNDDHRIVIPDAHADCLRFHPDLHNQFCLEERLKSVLSETEYAQFDQTEMTTVIALYDSVFNHHAFTGRSGSMFAYEGLGSIYWHMISKLLLAVQESYLHALNTKEPDSLCRQLDECYEHIRDGLGFRKSAKDYGAFPTDPYSHTPSHAGAQQPGMTGQVKEELLTRRGELGIRIHDGMITFLPVHRLIQNEFTQTESTYNFIAVSGRAESLTLAPNSLGFTLCQTPVIYHKLPAKGEPEVIVTLSNGQTIKQSGNTLPQKQSQSLFRREAEIQKIEVML